MPDVLPLADSGFNGKNPHLGDLGVLSEAGGKFSFQRENTSQYLRIFSLSV